MDGSAITGPFFTPAPPRIAYSLAGDSGPAVLLVMGYGMRGSAWEPQVDALRRDHRLCFYDHLGVGDSDDAPGPVTIRGMAADALRVMDAAGFARAHLVGVSMGGMIAQELALRSPERFESLSLIATHAGGLRGMLPPRRGLRCFVRAQIAPPSERVRALTELLYPEAFVARADRASLEARMRQTVGRRAKRRTLIHQLRAIALHDSRRRVGAITLPTLIVRPGLDVLIHPSHSDELHRQMPGSTLLRIDDAGHGCIFQSAETLAGALRDHFRAASS